MKWNVRQKTEDTPKGFVWLNLIHNGYLQAILVNEDLLQEEESLIFFLESCEKRIKDKVDKT